MFPKRRFVFRVGTLIDGRNPEVKKDMCVITDDAMISDILPYSELTNDFTEDYMFFDLPGMSLMPGLIDAHVHLWGETTMDYFHRLGVPEEVKLLRCTSDLKKLIEAGFTAVRDCGGGCGVHLRTCVDEGTLVGPRIVTSYRFLSQTAGHGDAAYLPLQWAQQSNKCRLVDGTDNVRKAAREQLREGADFVKICTSGGIMSKRFNAKQAQFTLDEVRAVVEEASRVGTFVSSHAGGNAGMKLALDGGVKTLEHGYFLDDPEIADEMVKRDTILVPTLILTSRIARGENHGVSPWALAKAKAALDSHVAAFRLARNAGVKIAMGSDTTGAPLLPHGDNAGELKMMVEAGMSPMEAITAATQLAAEALGLQNEIGSIDKGKFADMLIVDGNPCDDISVLIHKQKIRKVIKGGQIVVDRDGSINLNP